MLKTILIIILCSVGGYFFERARWRDMMAKYIDRETVGSLMVKYGFHAPDMTIREFVEDELPVADVAPVVRGRFVHDGPRLAGGVDWWHCSSCGRLVSGVETRFDYCPHCGAKMDGGNS